jgi:hypothetical protein
MKKLNKIFSTNVCLTSRKSILILVIILFSSFVLASVWPGNIEEEIKETPPHNSIDSTQMWIPTQEDIEYQDSMYQIIQNTQNDIEDIKEDIVLIIERLDYEDGTYDSIRYVKGGAIDKRRNN